MDVTKTAPALLPVAAWLGGLLWAFGLGCPPVALSACGLALSLAWVGRRGAGVLFAFFAALLVASAHGPRVQPQLDVLVGHNVELRGRALGHADGEGERVFLLEASSLRLRERVYPLATDILVVLGNEDQVGGLSVEWGDHLVLRGFLSAPGKSRNDNPAWPGLYRLRVKSDRLAEVRERGSWLDGLAAFLRNRAEASLAAWPADPRSAGFLRCLLLGDRTQLPDAWARTFNAVGLGHALSVSGFHISLFFLCCWGLTSFFPYRYRLLRLCLVATVLVFYLLLVGPRPAALRAGIMGLAVVAALIFRRPVMALNSLAISALLLTLDRPQLVLDLGFQLTLLATLGLGVSQWLVEVEGPPLKHLLAADLGAELMTMPLLLPRTALWHPLGILFNAVASPWLGILMAIGSLYLAAASASLPVVAVWLARLFDLLCRPLDGAEVLLPSRLLSMPIPRAELVAWLVPIGALAWLRWRQRFVWVILIGVLAGMNGAEDRTQRRLEAAFIDVGQGDATLLIDGHEAILIDGGGWRRGDPAARILVPALARLGVHRLAAVVLSHGDLDHCGGLEGLTWYWPMAELWASKETISQGCGRAVRERVPLVRSLRAGDRLQFRRWQIEVLWPPKLDVLPTGNNQSLVLRAQTGDRSILLTGDIEKAAENGLLAAAPELLEAEVLKVAHHGSRSSSTLPFLEAAKPQWAVISVGEANHFGHPAAEVVERLRRGGSCKVLRTDRHGLIRLSVAPGGRSWRLQLWGMPAGPYRMSG